MCFHRCQSISRANTLLARRSFDKRDTMTYAKPALIPQSDTSIASCCTGASVRIGRLSVGGSCVIPVPPIDL